MKKLAKILTLALVVVLAVSMVACSSYKKVEKALTNIGYEVIETNDTAEKMEKESDVPVTMHLFSKGFNVVFVLEFKATDDMIEYYKQSDTMQGLIKDIKDDGSAKEFYDTLVEKGFAKGNCLVFSLIPSADVTNAIKNA